MGKSNYLKPDDVIEAFTKFGGEAEWTDIEKYITQKRGHLYAPYKDIRNYKNVMFQIVQQHCKGYSKFTGPILFEKIRTGRFRLLVSSRNEPNRIRISPNELHPETVRSDREYKVGTVHQVYINAFERDPNARRECIDFHGLHCSVCMMSFEQQYGQIGIGFIHVHHIKPLSYREVYILDPVRDLIPVCPNCHAMLHTYDPPLTIDELKEEIMKRIV